MEYTGYLTKQSLDPDVLNMYENQEANFLLENQYLLIEQDGQIVDKYKRVGDKVERVKFLSAESLYHEKVQARNIEQSLALDLLLDSLTTIKVLSGPFGSGKDYLMVSAALSLIEKGVYDKIVYVRNNVEVKDTVPLGALPGSLFEKIVPFALPLADHVGGLKGLEYLIAQEKIEVQHLGYIRGRDIKKSIILSSEAENLTKQHVQLLIGRVGEGSALWLNGDEKQSDKQVFKDNSGLRLAIERLKGHPLFGYVHLVKSERSATAQLADLLDD